MIWLILATIAIWVLCSRNKDDDDDDRNNDSWLLWILLGFLIGRSNRRDDNDRW